MTADFWNSSVIYFLTPLYQYHNKIKRPPVKQKFFQNLSCVLYSVKAQTSPKQNVQCFRSEDFNSMKINVIKISYVQETFKDLSKKKIFQVLNMMSVTEKLPLQITLW